MPHLYPGSPSADKRPVRQEACLTLGRGGALVYSGFSMLQPEQSTGLDRPLKKVFGSKSQATKARLSLPEV